MQIGEKMKRYRKKHKLDLEVMAKTAKVTTGLLELLESGGVTHPELAKRIGRSYGLSELETEQLMPENHRKHSPNYDPDRYKIEPKKFNDALMPKPELIDIYIGERQREDVRSRRKYYGS